MRRYGKHTDEDDIRQRPNRKGNRPRTTIRPKHEDAVEGMVLTVDRGRLTCLVDDRVVMAMKARELGRKAAVVGDRVSLVGDLSGEKDTLARIVRIGERSSVLRRTADDDDPFERVVVANADQLAIVTALADPEPRPRLIDRCLVAAYDGGLSPSWSSRSRTWRRRRSCWSCTARWTSRTWWSTARSCTTARRRTGCGSTWATG